MGKPVQNGIGEQSSKVLVSLEDFTSLRGDELLQGLYVVVLGYNMDMKNASKRSIEISKIKSSIREGIKTQIDPASQTSSNGIGNSIKTILTKSIEMITSKATHIVDGNIITKTRKMDKTDLISEFVNNTASIITSNSNITDLTQALPSISDLLTEMAINFKKCESLEKINNETSNSINHINLKNERRFNPPLDSTPISIANTPKQSTIGEGRDSIIYTNKADDFFFCWHSPVMMVQRGRQYQFPNGYPLFYGIPKRQTSIYVAVLDIAGTDPKGICNLNQSDLLTPGAVNLEDAITAFQSIHYAMSSFLSEERKKIVFLEDRERNIFENFETIKTAFSLLIKAFETRALNLKHQIRYTNVLTLKENDEWLEGGHQDWGDQRMAMTIKVEVSK